MLLLYLLVETQLFILLVPSVWCLP